MGWFFVSIILPLAAPVAAMWFLQRLPLPVSTAQRHLLVPLKDGQLCWGAVAFCGSAMYEIAVPGPDGPIVTAAMSGYLNTGFIILLAASAIIAAGGAVFPTEINFQCNERWYKQYQALATSLALTVLAAGSYTVVHYGLLKA